MREDRGGQFTSSWISIMVCRHYDSREFLCIQSDASIPGVLLFDEDLRVFACWSCIATPNSVTALGLTLHLPLHMHLSCDTRLVICT